MLDVIKAEVTRVGGVLEGFRDFASIQRLNLSRVDLVELIDRQVKLIEPQARQQSIDIRLQRPDARLPSVNVDTVRFEQVLLNLLINAMQAIGHDGTIKIQLSVRRDRDPESFRIEISDTGPGVPEDLRSRIFDPYFTTKNQGIGMGLALCDKIVRQHHGELEFQAGEHGSVFIINLPLE
jgi:two-component system nitrogen regulation sensor histidine kinase GlnL